MTLASPPPSDPPGTCRQEPPGGGYNGWARLPRGRWRCLVRGAQSDREALEALRRLTAGEPFIDLCVLAPGRHPGDGLGGPPVRPARRI